MRGWVRQTATTRRRNRAARESRRTQGRLRGRRRRRGTPQKAAPVPPANKSLEGLESELGGGEAIGGREATLAQSVGADPAAIRKHTGPVAAQTAAKHDAMAFAAGTHIVMGSGAPTTGTSEGDELLLHEAAHVAQQQDAARDPVQRAKPIAELVQANSRAALFVAEHGESGVYALLEADGDAALAETKLPKRQLESGTSPTSPSPTAGAADNSKQSASHDSHPHSVGALKREPLACCSIQAFTGGRPEGNSDQSSRCCQRCSWTEREGQATHHLDYTARWSRVPVNDQNDTEDLAHEH